MKVRLYQTDFHRTALTFFLLSSLSGQANSGDSGKSPFAGCLQSCKRELGARTIDTDDQLCRFRERVTVSDDFSDAPSESVSQDCVAKTLWNRQTEPEVDPRSFSDAKTEPIPKKPCSFFENTLKFSLGT